jgi:hypothetical protein
LFSPSCWIFKDSTLAALKEAAPAMETARANNLTVLAIFNFMATTPR